MNKIAALSLALAYIGFVFFAVPYIGPIWSPWVLSVASLVFVLGFIRIRGKGLWAVSLVAIFTLLFSSGRPGRNRVATLPVVW